MSRWLFMYQNSIFSSLVLLKKKKSFLLLIRGQIMGVAGKHTFPSPPWLLPAHLGESLGVPTQLRDVVHPGSSTGPPPSGMWPKHKTREVSRGQPLNLAPFNAEKQQVYSEPLQMTDVHILSPRKGPATLKKETDFSHSSTTGVTTTLLLLDLRFN